MIILGDYIYHYLNDSSHGRLPVNDEGYLDGEIVVRRIMIVFGCNYTTAFHYVTTYLDTFIYKKVIDTFGEYKIVLGYRNWVVMYKGDEYYYPSFFTKSLPSILKKESIDIELIDPILVRYFKYFTDRDIVRISENEMGYLV